MKTIALTDRIRLAHCDGGDQGGHGMLFLLDRTGNIEQFKEYETRDEFKFHYTNLAVTERTQDELAKALVMA